MSYYKIMIRGKFIYLDFKEEKYGKPSRHFIVIASVVILLIALVFWGKCEHRDLFLYAAIISLLTYLALLAAIFSLHKTSKIINAKSVILHISCALAMFVTGIFSAVTYRAYEQLDEKYRKNPLTVKEIIQGVPFEVKSTYRLNSEMSLLFAATMDFCGISAVSEDITPSSPDLGGSIKNGTYQAPKLPKGSRQLVTLKFSNPHNRDFKLIHIDVFGLPKEVDGEVKKGRDKSGKEASFHFFVVAKDYSWKFESIDTIEAPLTKKEMAVSEYISSLAKNNLFQGYSDLIAVGTASQEGNDAGEEKRAGDRSEKIANVLFSTSRRAKGSPEIYALNLGKHQKNSADVYKPSKDQTAPERPVIVIAVERREKVNIAEALNDALSKFSDDKVFRFLAQKYPSRILCKADLNGHLVC